MEYQHWLREAISQLQASESPRRDAEILLEHVTGKGRTFILAFGETQLTDEQCQQLDALLTRRRDGEPIAHLTGVREFWSLPLFVSPATLIPRPDTECLVEQALARLPEQPCRILDLGTGTGAIALALASERPDCAMIVSNPPYIDEQDPHLQQGDVRFEPLTALVAADSGMADIVHIIEQSRNALVSGGFLLLEHGWQQGEAVRQAFILAGYHDVETCRDYGDNERVTLGRYYQ